MPSLTIEELMLWERGKVYYICKKELIDAKGNDEKIRIITIVQDNIEVQLILSVIK